MMNPIDPHLDDDGTNLEPVVMPGAPEAVCPECGTFGTLQFYVHGFPTTSVQDDPRAIIAGCVMGPEPMRVFHCAQCGADFDPEGGVIEPVREEEPPSGPAPRIRPRRYG